MAKDAKPRPMIGPPFRFDRLCQRDRIVIDDIVIDIEHLNSKFMTMTVRSLAGRSYERDIVPLERDGVLAERGFYLTSRAESA